MQCVSASLHIGGAVCTKSAIHQWHGTRIVRREWFSPLPPRLRTHPTSVLMLWPLRPGGTSSVHAPRCGVSGKAKSRTLTASTKASSLASGSMCVMQMHMRIQNSTPLVRRDCCTGLESRAVQPRQACVRQRGAAAALERGSKNEAGVATLLIRKRRHGATRQRQALVKLALALRLLRFAPRQLLSRARKVLAHARRRADRGASLGPEARLHIVGKATAVKAPLQNDLQRAGSFSVLRAARARAAQRR